MTVSSIGALAPEIKRLQENTTRTATTTPSTQTQSGSAVLPTDTVSLPILKGPTPDEFQQIAIQNAQAAQSVLSDTDIDALAESKLSPQQAVQQQAKASIDAQTKRLPPSMLELLAE
jgi:hypothetical protein